MKKLDAYVLLNSIKEANSPVGAIYLSKILEVPSATIGRMLKIAEDEGYITSVSNKGRVITPKGISYLDKIDIINSKREAARNLINCTSSMSTEHILEILQVRRLIEPYAAALACSNATEKQLEELDVISIEHLVNIRKGNLGSEQDLQLHLTIAKCSKNTTIYHILELMLMENSVYNILSSISSALKRAEITKHDDIIKAIKARDSKAASLAMESHLDMLIENTKYYANMVKSNS